MISTKSRFLPSSQSGFTLIELAIVIVIIGFLLAGSIALLEPYLKSSQRNSTIDKMNIIAASLSDFAQQHGRLPCPADPNQLVATEPFGSPRNSGALGDQLDNICNSTVATGGALGNFIGIVPFRALGLSQDAVRDGYGRYITYAASPSVTGRDNTPMGGDQVHSQCRQSFWIDPAGGTNLNARNARICCAPPDQGPTINDITLQDDVVAGNSLFGGIHSVTASDYADIDILDPTPANTNAQFIAFTLISHGTNGVGAYSGVGNQQLQGADYGSVNEEENNDGDTLFIDQPLVTNENTSYFDDIVLWRTNHQLVSAFGNASCSRP